MELKLNEAQKGIFNKNQLVINGIKQRLEEKEQEQINLIVALTGDANFKNGKVENGVLTWESSIKEEKNISDPQIILP